MRRAGFEPAPLVYVVRQRASLPGAEVPCPVVFYTTGPVPVHPQLSYDVPSPFLRRSSSELPPRGRSRSRTRWFPRLRFSRPAGVHTPLPSRYCAESAGFEPAGLASNGLASRRLRPLSQPSGCQDHPLPDALPHITHVTRLRSKIWTSQASASVRVFQPCPPADSPLLISIREASRYDPQDRTQQPRTTEHPPRPRRFGTRHVVTSVPCWLRF